MANLFDADATSADEELATTSIRADVEEEIPDWTTHIGATLVSQPITWAQSSIKVARNVLNFAKSTIETDEPSNAIYPWCAPLYRQIGFSQRIG